jgi:hypothetical protein
MRVEDDGVRVRVTVKGSPFLYTFIFNVSIFGHMSYWCFRYFYFRRYSGESFHTDSEI